MDREGKTFEDEELVWPEVNPKWTPEKLLKQKGMFRFREVKKILGLETKHFSLLRRNLNDDSRVYQEYGIKRPLGKQYVIRMSVFRKVYKKMLDSQGGYDISVQCIPEDITNVNDLLKLEGVYHLRDLERFDIFKVHNEAIKSIARKANSPSDAQANYGVWFQKKGRKFIVELPRFVEWFHKTMWHGEQE